MKETPVERQEDLPGTEPWHYDAFEGRPGWSVETGKQRALRRQTENTEGWSDRHRGEAA